MAGPGFRDFSRIAASDPAVWRDILIANRTEVLAQLSHFQAELNKFEKFIENNDLQGLHGLIAKANQVRASWDMQAGDDN